MFKPRNLRIQRAQQGTCNRLFVETIRQVKLDQPQTSKLKRGLKRVEGFGRPRWQA